MDHRKEIKEVGTIISKGRMRVCLTVEDFNQPIYLSFRQIKRVVDISVTELELLTGSELEFSFYKPGETMGNGKTYQKGFYKMVKGFNIHLIDTLENLRKQKSYLLKKFLKVAEIFTFIRKGQQQVGIKAEDWSKYYFSAKFLSGLTKLQPPDYDLLIGAHFFSEYYQKGEITYFGERCRISNVLLKSLTLRYPLGFNPLSKAPYLYDGDYLELDEDAQIVDVDDYENENYGYQDHIDRDPLGGSSWLEIVAGTDDPKVMNDVYWNLD